MFTKVAGERKQNSSAARTLKEPLKMSTTTTQVGNLLITTQVINVADTAGLNVPQPTTTLTPVASKYFKTIPVKALSTILMLVGILQLGMGLMFYGTETKIVSLTLESGVYIWGGLVVFAAGVACLSALSKDTINMVKVCMRCNITNIVVAAVGLILFSIQIYYESQACWLDISLKNHSACPIVPDYDYHYYYYYSVQSDLTMQLRVSLNIIAILFSLLGLVISCFMTAVSDKVLKSSDYSLLK